VIRAGDVIEIQTHQEHPGLVEQVVSYENSTGQSYDLLLLDVLSRFHMWERIRDVQLLKNGSVWDGFPPADGDRFSMQTRETNESEGLVTIEDLDESHSLSPEMASEFLFKMEVDSPERLWFVRNSKVWQGEQLQPNDVIKIRRAPGMKLPTPKEQRQEILLPAREKHIRWASRPISEESVTKLAVAMQIRIRSELEIHQYRLCKGWHLEELTTIIANCEQKSEPEHWRLFQEDGRMASNAGEMLPNGLYELRFEIKISIEVDHRILYWNF
jgi:hypothetical protein